MNRQRYVVLVPLAVRLFEEQQGFEPCDWYIPGAANPVVYLESLERMFPEPEPTTSRRSRHEPATE